MRLKKKFSGKTPRDFMGSNSRGRGRDVAERARKKGAGWNRQTSLGERIYR
jgi:hypothetical protein